MSDELRKQHIKKCGSCGKTVKWIHGSKPVCCPYCNQIKWDKPADECKLFNLQKTFLKTRDKKILGEMYPILYSYTKRIILKMLKSKVSYDEDKLEDKIQGTVVYFLSYYMRYDTYKVTDSFGFLLQKGAQQELYNKKIKDTDINEFSYDQTLQDGETTILDELKATEPPKEIEKDSIENDLMDFIDKMFSVVYKTRGLEKAVVSMQIIHTSFEKKRIDYDSLCSEFGTDYKKLVDLERFSIYEFMKDMRNYNYC